MSLAPGPAPAAFSNADGVAAAIREGGGRLSSTCRILLKALFSADGPISAPHIAEGLGGGIIDLDVSSVYRNLQRFEELGVVRRVHVGNGPRLYALQDGSQREYLACEACGRVETVDGARLDGVRAEIHSAFSYRARFTDFALIGVCPECAGGDGFGATVQARSHGST